jgi:hypothetical protein
VAGARVRAVHAAVGFATIGLTAGAFLIGAWCYWRVRSTDWFWRVLRVSQAAVVVSVALGGVDRLTGHKVAGLHVLYGVLPILVSFIAEQLRVASAQTVLDARGFESAKQVGRLDAQEQRVIVTSIVQREILVMTLACLVNVVLLARAAGTA